MAVLSVMPAHVGTLVSLSDAGLGPQGHPTVAARSSALPASRSSRHSAAQCLCVIQAPRAAFGRSEFSGCGSPLGGLTVTPPSRGLQGTAAVRRLSVQSSSAGGEGSPGASAAAASGSGKASSSGSAAAAAAAAAAATTLRRAPQQRPSVPFFPPDASSEEDEPAPRSTQQAPSQRPQSQPLGGKASSPAAVPGAGAGAGVPGRASVAVSAEGAEGAPLRKRWGSNSDLDPSRPLPLAMTAQTRPLTPEEVQEQLNCDPELQFCKDPVYQWTSKCTKCAGSGYARSFSSRGRKGGKGKSYGDCKCITCCGIGYVYRFTTRNDIPVMGDVEWEDK